MRIFLLFIFFLLSSPVDCFENRPWLSAGGGVLRPDDPHGVYLIDIRSPLFRKVLRGQIGALGEGTKSGYLFGGIGFETPVWKPIYCYLNFSPGVYFQGEGVFLGFPIEFRSSVDLIYQMTSFLRLGAAFFHISNASLGERNPGVNGIILYFSTSFGHNRS